MAPSAFRQNAILAKLRGEILDGTLAAGQRLPTRSELIARYEASSVTVQLVLDTLIADGFVEPRGRSGTFVADHPPHLCHYGLVIAGTLAERAHWPHFWNALDGEARHLFGKGPRSMTVYYGIASRDERHYPKLLHDVQARRLAGLVFATNPHWLVNTPVLDLPGIPRVTIGDSQGSSVASVVRLENERFFALAVGRLADRGRRRVALLTVPGIDPRQREDFLGELARHGLETRPEWQQAAVIEYPQWAENVMRLLFRAGTGTLPDALIITDDNLVGPATAGLKALGLRCPEDIEVIAHTNFPAVTASALPITRLGYDAHALLELCVADLDRQRRMPEHSLISGLAPVFAPELSPISAGVEARS